MKNKNIILYLTLLYGFAKAVAGDISIAEEIKSRGKLEEMVSSEASSLSYMEEIAKQREKTIHDIWQYCKENEIAPYILGLDATGHKKINREWAESGSPLLYIVGPGYYRINLDELHRVDEKNADLYFGVMKEDGTIKIELKNNKYEIAIPPIGYGSGPCDAEPYWGNTIDFKIFERMVPENCNYNQRLDPTFDPRFAVRAKDDKTYHLAYRLDFILKGKNIFALDMSKIDGWNLPLDVKNEK